MMTNKRGMRYGVKGTVNSGFIVNTTLKTMSEHDAKYLLYVTIASCYTKGPIEKGHIDIPGGVE